MQIVPVERNNTMSNTIKINYSTSVFTPAGWRNVGITATATKVSDKMASVTEVLEINGQAPKASMSRTGASRQKFNGCGISRREVGSNKRLSSCTIL